MLYRVAGQYKTSYKADYALFPVKQDAWLLGIILLVCFVILPLMANEFAFRALLIPVLIYSLAALGLNILTGYAGQLSLGTGAFMGVGAYACYKLTTIFPDLNIVVALALSGFFSASVGMAFGLPSLRIKGFYLAIATLAAQFFWCGCSRNGHGFTITRHPVRSRFPIFRCSGSLSPVLGLLR